MAQIWPRLHNTGEYDNGAFTVKMYQMFTVPHRFENVTDTSHLGSVCLRKTWAGKSHNYRNIIVFIKLIFQNVVYSPKETAFFKFPRFQERFRVELLWTVNLTIEIKLRFTNSPAQCRRGVNHLKNSAIKLMQNPSFYNG